MLPFNTTAYYQAYLNRPQINAFNRCDVIPVNRENGFTLIEALVAMFIFAWISLASYQILDQVILAQDGNQRQSGVLSKSQRVSWQLAKDFRQMVNRPVYDENGDVLGPLVLNDGTNIIEFTRSGWSNPLQWPRSELQRVAYTVDYHPESDKPSSEFYNDDRLYLIRLYWQVLDRTLESKPQKQVMLGGIVDIRTRFWDAGSSEWVDVPLLNFAAQRDLIQYGLPAAVEVSIVLDSEDVITQIYRVL